MQGSAEDRKAKFARNLKALNEQFAAYVCTRQTDALHFSWLNHVPLIHTHRYTQKGFYLYLLLIIVYRWVQLG
jgi:hypothetical protein